MNYSSLNYRRCTLDIFRWCAAVAPPHTETNGLSSNLFLSLAAWLHPATREEVHSCSKRWRGGPRVSPPCFSQGHNLLVEGGRAADGHWEVGVCTSLHAVNRILLNFEVCRCVCASAQSDLTGLSCKAQPCSIQTFFCFVFFIQTEN